MNLTDLRDKLNSIIDKGYGNVNCIGECHKEDDYIEWRYLEDIKIVDRDGHGGAGLNLIFEE